MIKVITQPLPSRVRSEINTYATDKDGRVLGLYGSNSSYIILGKYETTERAEEVMKEGEIKCQ